MIGTESSLECATPGMGRNPPAKKEKKKNKPRKTHKIIPSHESHTHSHTSHTSNAKPHRTVRGRSSADTEQSSTHPHQMEEHPILPSGGVGGRGRFGDLPLYVDGVRKGPSAALTT
eukprot:7239961-Prymnesium_polylepis.1